jgi:UDP-N-acetylmuramate dehydrogenase
MAFLWRKKKRFGALEEKHRDFIVAEFRERALFGVPMKNYTSMRVGGPADCMVFPDNVEQLIKIISYARAESLPVTVIGYGTNLLVKDGGIRGITINLSKGFKTIEKEEHGNDVYITAGSGVSLARIVRLGMDNGWKGVEPLSAIPGSLGGAVFMNAGTKDGTISDVIDSVWIIDGEREKLLDRKMLKFEYRSVNIPKNHPVVKVKIKLQTGNKEEVRAKIQESLRYRKETQPLTERSSGCIFKNPRKISAGKLIDDLGLKGVRVRGAKISEKHANFIVNTGTATAKDVLALIELVKEKVKEERNILLETEVIIVGEE